MSQGEEKIELEFESKNGIWRMEMDILSLGCLIILSIPVMVQKNIKIERAIFITIGILVGAAYIGGIFGNLLYGIIPVVCILVLWTIYLLYKRVELKNLFTYGLLFVIIMLFISIIYHQNTVVTTWDDFAMWAIAPKNMFYSNQFHNALGNTMRRCTDYLPGIPLYSYIWMKIGNEFCDTRLFVSYNMFVYIVLAAFLTNIKAGLKSLILGIILVVAPNCFLANGWSMLGTLQIDTIMAVLFGYLLYIVIVDEYEETEIYAGIFLMVLSKQVGMIFAAIIIAMLIIKFLCNHKNVVVRRKLLCKIMIPIVEILFVLVSWSLVKKSNAVSIDRTGVYKEILEKGVGYFRELEFWKLNGFINFWKSFIKYNTIPDTSQTAYYITPFIKVSGIVWLSILTIGLILVLRKRNRKINCWYGLIIGAGFVGYALFISSLYLINFSKGENAILSSAGRYIGTYFLAVYLVIIGIYFNYVNEKVTLKLNIILIILLIIIPCNNIKSTHLGGMISGFRIRKNEALKERLVLQDKVNYIINLVGTNANIIVDNNGDVLQNIRLNYLLYPNQVPLWGYISRLEPQYTHIILNNTANELNGEFKELYGDYFNESEIVDGGIYSISHLQEKIELHYLGKIDW